MVLITTYTQSLLWICTSTQHLCPNPRFVKPGIYTGSENSILLLGQRGEKKSKNLKIGVIPDSSVSLIPYKQSISKTFRLYTFTVFITWPPLITPSPTALVHASNVIICRLHAVASYLVPCFYLCSSFYVLGTQRWEWLSKTRILLTRWWWCRSHHQPGVSYRVGGKNIKEALVNKVLVLVYQFLEYLPW